MGGASTRKKREKKKDFQVCLQARPVVCTFELINLNLESEVEGREDQSKSR